MAARSTTFFTREPLAAEVSQDGAQAWEFPQHMGDCEGGGDGQGGKQRKMNERAARELSDQRGNRDDEEGV